MRGNRSMQLQGVKALHIWNEWNAVNIMREPHRQSAKQPQQQQTCRTLSPDSWYFLATWKVFNY
ncbi:hypothetical protein TSUD_221020 [Trifolium subterraneum]|uniref:Uncharacterized protein n=1 Tax=Trifolium subterraneum TaxID=3900 RepID=A0A2Z6MRT9_TRISU|nr:hypothetical protein TSUD_221020 [Trifolium subterraneum]